MSFHSSSNSSTESPKKRGRKKGSTNAKKRDKEKDKDGDFSAFSHIATEETFLEQQKRLKAAEPQDENIGDVFGGFSDGLK